MAQDIEALAERPEMSKTALARMREEPGVTYVNAYEKVSGTKDWNQGVGL